MSVNVSSKPVIAVDLDDVLKESSQLIIDYSNQKWGTDLTIDDYDEHWAAMWQVDNAEWEARAHQIHSEKLLIHGEPFLETKRVLELLSRDYTLVVASSRQQIILEDTREWLRLHFGGLFQNVHFAGIWDDTEIDGAVKVKQTKASLLKEIGADYLIDDQPKHCIAAAEIGVQAILFGEYPWNIGVGIPGAGVTRINDWKGVEAYFHAKRR